MGKHGEHRPLVKLAAAAWFGLCCGPVEACRLALVLAMDVSTSIDDAEDRLQRAGLAAALLAEPVQDAFFASSDPVALLVYEWSGRSHQGELVPWAMIKAPDDLARVSAQIARSHRSARDLPTGLGHALAYGSIRLRDGPSCLFQTIDLSGDGPNNDGFGPSGAYATFPFDGVTVNALAIRTGNADPAAYYAQSVARGPLSFVETADGFADFEAAMSRKLIRELSSQVIGSVTSERSIFQ